MFCTSYSAQVQDKMQISYKPPGVTEDLKFVNTNPDRYDLQTTINFVSEVYEKSKSRTLNEIDNKDNYLITELNKILKNYDTN